MPALLLFAPVEEGRCASLRGTGDFEFYLDVASLPAPGESAVQLIQIAIPTKELRYVKSGGKYIASVRYTFDLRTDETVIFNKTFQMRDSRDAAVQDADLSAFIYVIDSCSVDPGSYLLTVKVEDLQRSKNTLLGILHRSYFSSTVRNAAIDVQEFPADRIALGDPVLVWAFDAAGNFIPNPMQIYGLKKDTLSVLIKAALPVSSTADSLAVRLSLSKATGEAMGEERFKVRVAGKRSAFVKRVDLTTYPAGAYRMTVEVDAGGGMHASAGKDFNVAWELLNWRKPARDILLEARILLHDDEYDAFAAMAIGEQESFMKRYWKKLDPTPQTEVNEAYEKFVNRVRYADAHFSIYRRGALSDRGFIYVRLGPPDEIINRPVPRDRDDLFEGIDKIMTDYKIIVDSYWMPKQTKDARPPIISPEKQRAVRGLVGDDTGSFEIWNYNLKGDPILIDDRRMTYDQGLRFLFLDKDGYGEYWIVGTSEEMMQGD